MIVVAIIGQTVWGRASRIALWHNVSMESGDRVSRNNDSDSSEQNCSEHVYIS